MITDDMVTRSPAMGDRVKRFHTWPMIREQTVGQHTAGCLRVYWMVFGGLPEAVAVYLLFHDTPEVGTGDPPHMVKRDNPHMKQEYDRMEDDVLRSMLGHHVANEILMAPTDIERVRMKAADLLEMGEHAEVEFAMGNRFAEPILRNVMLALQKLALSKYDRDLVDKYIGQHIMRWREQP